MLIVTHVQALGCSSLTRGLVRDCVFVADMCLEVLRVVSLDAGCVVPLDQFNAPVSSASVIWWCYTSDVCAEMRLACVHIRNCCNADALHRVNALFVSDGRGREGQQLDRQIRVAA